MLEFGVIKLFKRVEAEQYDTLVFLDRGARPLAWLFVEFWRKKNPGKKLPGIIFVNPRKDYGQYPREDEEFKRIFGESIPGSGEVVGRNVCIVDEKAVGGVSFYQMKARIESLKGKRKIDTHEMMIAFPMWQGTAKYGVYDRSDNEPKRYKRKNPDEEVVDPHESVRIISKIRPAESMLMRNEIKQIARTALAHYDEIAQRINDEESKRSLEAKLKQNNIVEAAGSAGGMKPAKGVINEVSNVFYESFVAFVDNKLTKAELFALYDELLNKNYRWIESFNHSHINPELEYL